MKLLTLFIAFFLSSNAFGFELEKIIYKDMTYDGIPEKIVYKVYGYSGLLTYDKFLKTFVTFYAP
ncbi:MAG: hypothetical protein JW944_10415 [Deltaproteobacteria bacterium]|nr:hypothetical protein [Deltaproteobacteria bacterium]